MRILTLVISLAIVAWLAYITVNRIMTSDKNIGIEEGDTIIDTVDYAKDAVNAANLSACLRLCGVDFATEEDCQAECNKKY